MFCTEILPMSRTRMTIKKSSGIMDSINAADYVDSNFDDFEDGWGINLMNLEEIAPTEEEMKKILPTLIEEADKKKKMMLEKKKQQTKTAENDEKGSKKDEKNVKK